MDGKRKTPGSSQPPFHVTIIYIAQPRRHDRSLWYSIPLSINPVWANADTMIKQVLS